MFGFRHGKTSDHSVTFNVSFICSLITSTKYWFYMDISYTFVIKTKGIIIDLNTIKVGNFIHRFVLIPPTLQSDRS